MIHERAELPRNRGVNSRDRRIMQYAYQEWMSPHAIVGMMIATVCVLGGFVFIGPMGTYDAFTPLQRLGFGSLCAFFGAPLFFAMDVVTLYFMRFRSALEVGLAVTMAALFVALPCAAVISTVETLVHADYSADAGLLRAYILAATFGVACSLLFLYVVYQRIKRTAGLAMPAAGGSGALAVAAGEGNEATADAAASADPLPDAGGTDNVTGQLDVQRGADEAEDDGAGSPEPARVRSNGTPPMAPAATESEESDPSGAPPKTEAPSGTRAVDGSQQLTAKRGDGEPHAAFLALLPRKLGTDLIYLKSEDHYVEVHTSVGSTLIKMRFADAVAELGEYGIQVHRSYWVATRHVRRLVKSGKRRMVRLNGGHELPVSASYLSAVRAAVPH